MPGRLLRFAKDIQEIIDWKVKLEMFPILTFLRKKQKSINSNS